MNRRELREIYAAGFGDGDAFLDYFFKKRYPAARCVTAERDGRIVSALYLFPRVLRVGAAELPVAFLSAAATLPAYRGRGILAEVMKKALAAAYEDGAAAVVLSPFREGYYERYGFGVFAREWRIEQDLGELPRRRLTLADAAAVKRIYAAHARGYDVVINRSIADIRARLAGLLDAGDGAYLYGDDTYAVEEGGEITEFCTVDPDFFMRHAGRGVSVPFSAREGRAAGMIKPLRLTDVVAAARGRADGELELEVTDAFFPENAGKYVLRVTNGKAELLPGGSGGLRVASEQLALAALGVDAVTPDVLRKYFWRRFCFLADRY